jgi:peptidoglycan-associated lipoprotein
MLTAPARMLKFAAFIAAGLALTACAKTPDPNADGAGGSGGSGLGAGAGVGAPGSVQDFASTAGDRVFFESDSTELSAASQATLDKQAAWLSRYGNYAFTVQGHADERGTREYNFALGARRADTVKEYLSARGIAASRIKTISYGKERPVAVCNDISCWSQNRRAVTALNGGNS